MLSYFSIPRKIGTTFSDIHYIDTRTPEDIVNEYRSAGKTSNPPSQNTPLLSKSTDHLPPTSYPNRPHPQIIQSHRMTHSTPLSSINLNNYYPDYFRSSYIPYRRVPHFPDHNVLGNQQHMSINPRVYPGMKLSRSDYYVSTKPSLYPVQQMVYPVNYSSLNPHQFSNY